MGLKFLLLVGLACISTVNAGRESVAANPIRKVVTMLQMMQKKIESEGEKEKQLFEKFMCYCKNGVGDLKKSIADAATKAGEVASDVEESQAKLAQDQEDLKNHRADRDAAKKALAEATAIREKDAAAFAKVEADDNQNLKAMDKAIAALEKGMAGGFLQTGSAQVLLTFVSGESSGVTDLDRQTIVSFLSGGTDYAPQSGEITGILKQMRDTMGTSLADDIAEEKSAIKMYNDLVAANTAVINSATEQIEKKLARTGELKVSIANMKADAEETADAAKEDEAFLENLGKSCKAKEEEYSVRVKTRSEELLALAETIKILNDDDALELFKKTLPSASASFVQVQVTSASMKSHALEAVGELRKTCKSHCAQLDLISLALRGKKVSFAKVITMIDEMSALLLKEQTGDDSKKEYCLATFDKLDDKKKSLERSVSDLEALISDVEEGIATLTSEIEALGAGIQALDKSVAEATEQRKEEHDDFNELVAQDTAAKELLGFAKNRLNKFYNPKLYVAPAPRELSRGDRIYENLGGDIPTATYLQKDAPAPPPETWGAYKKKGGESSGVIEMIDILIADLDKELTEHQTEEKNAQADYEKLMADSAAKRASDAKLLEEKGGAKADGGAKLLAAKEEQDTTRKSLEATLEVIHSTHGECDWLLQNFDARKAARAGEVDSLKNAKAILSGADYALLQMNTAQTFLRKHA